MGINPELVRYNEVVVRCIPQPGITEMRRQRSRPPGDAATQAYAALIYTDLDMPSLRITDPAPAGQPRDVAGLPLVGVEQIVVRWSRYQDYLRMFSGGEKDAWLMRERLFETLSPGLERLFAQPQDQQPLRLWWYSETPELDDLPWELVVYASGNQQPGQFSFVRGLPAEPAPLTPLENGLRLAVCGSQPPPGLQAALEQCGAAVHLIQLGSNVRQALQEAVKTGCELVHIIADGTVSLAFEGLLSYVLPDGTSAALTSSELDRILLGSRVSLISLSAPDLPLDPDQAPTAYRAFSYLSRLRQAPPTILAQHGPLPPPQAEGFWAVFYQELADRLSIEEAVVSARTSVPGLPLALFLRHRAGREFRRWPISFTSGEGRSLYAQPNSMFGYLQVSRDFLERLAAIDAQFKDLPDNLTDSSLVEQVRIQQADIARALDTWTTLEEGER